MTLEVLIPTRNRPVELATVLAGLAAQHDPFDVLVSDQSTEQPSYATPGAGAMVRVLRRQGRRVRLVRHLPRNGLAEHRQSLLDNSTAGQVLFLDDDVWLQPRTTARLRDALRILGCGLVGSAVQGLSYLDDERPQETACYEEWDGPPRPERITVGSPQWHRWTLHNAANLVHVERRLNLAPGEWRAYKIAWIGGCVLYDRAKLLDCGGFTFWRALPPEHVGEDVVAQWRVLARYGGAGVLPSGAVHLESPTTIAVREVDAPRFLDPHELGCRSAVP